MSGFQILANGMFFEAQQYGDLILNDSVCVCVCMARGLVRVGRGEKTDQTRVYEKEFIFGCILIMIF